MTFDIFKQNKLSKLVKKYTLDTDKSAYFPVYEKYFSPIRNKELNILELGVLRGGSLLLWHYYFPNSKIVGLDINNVVMEKQERIYVYQGEQQGKDVIDKICEIHGKFDIIIDDASHIGEFTSKSFELLFDEHLVSGGIYVIEDWGTGYWGDWQDGSKFKNNKVNGNVFESHQGGMVGFAKQLIDCLAHKDIELKNKNVQVLTKNISSIDYYGGQIFVKRK
jgi:hypothetical protein